MPNLDPNALAPPPSCPSVGEVDPAVPPPTGDPFFEGPPGSWRVLKLGGTSMASAHAIRNALAEAGRARRSGRRVAFVVSALSGVTDRLLHATTAPTEEALEILRELARRHRTHLDASSSGEARREGRARLRSHELRLEHRLRIRDPSRRNAVEMVATGERFAAAILTAAARSAGLPAQGLDAGELLVAGGLSTEARGDLSRSRWRSVTRIGASAPALLVVPGFSARGVDGRLHLLGRGGSDTAAVLLGSALGAGRVEIWTDVDGVFGEDPRIRPDQVPFPWLSYDDAERRAAAGAKVLHPDAVAPGRSTRTAIWIRNSFRPTSDGTWIDADPRSAEIRWAARHLTRLCAVDSTTGREGRIRSALRELLAHLGAHTEEQLVPDQGGSRHNVLARWSDDPVLLLTTHLDTVPPYLPPSRDARGIAGRGACDAKGQIVAQLAAVRRLVASGERRIAWLGVVGEETDGDGARAALGWSSLPRGIRAVINGEPTGARAARAQKGYLHLRLVTHGSAGHGARPEGRDNALWTLWDWLQRLRDLPLHRDGELGDETWQLGRLSGGTAANVVPECAQAEIVVRTVTGSRFLELARALAPSGSELEVLTDDPPVRFAPSPGGPGPVLSFGSDAPRWATLAPVHQLGPGRIEVAHSADERLDFDELERGIDAIHELATWLLRDPTSPSGPGAGR